jgi:hypothetical protein
MVLGDAGRSSKNSSNMSRRVSGPPLSRATTPNGTQTQTKKRATATRSQTLAGKSANSGTPDWDSLTGSTPSSVLASLDEAREFLRMDSLIAPNTPITSTSLACAILVIADQLKENSPNQKALRAIAKLLHDDNISTIASLITSRVSDILEPLLDSAKSTNAQAVNSTSTLTTEQIELATHTLARQTDEIYGDQGRLADIAETANAALELLQGQAAHLAERINTSQPQTHTNQPFSQPLFYPEPPPASFQYESFNSPAPTAPAPAAFSQQTSSQDPRTFPPLPSLMQRMSPPQEVVASSQAAGRNLIFDLSAVAAEQAKSMTEAQLVERANVAVDQLGELAATCPVDKVFASAKVLKRGGIRYLMTNTLATEWIQRADVKREFLTSFFEGEGTLTQRLYPTIVEFVPVYFNAGNPDAHRELERANGLEAESISKCHWLKRPEARSQNQSCAHLEITFTAKSAANQAMRDRLVMDGRHLLVRKKLSEPEKCTKCQVYTAAHRAKTCRKQIQCARCLGSHWTSECDADEVQCINCKKDGRTGADITHRASDCTCPVYLQHVEKKRRTHPENKYRYFIDSSDPRTWELADWQPINDPNQWYANGTADGHQPAPNPPGAWRIPHRRSQEPEQRGRTPQPRPHSKARSTRSARSTSSSQRTTTSLRQLTLPASFTGTRRSSWSADVPPFPRIPSPTAEGWDK